MIKTGLFDENLSFQALKGYDVTPRDMTSHHVIWALKGGLEVAEVIFGVHVTGHGSFVVNFSCYNHVL